MRIWPCAVLVSFSLFYCPRLGRECLLFTKLGGDEDCLQPHQGLAALLAWVGCPVGLCVGVSWARFWFQSWMDKLASCGVHQLAQVLHIVDNCYWGYFSSLTKIVLLWWVTGYGAICTRRSAQPGQVHADGLRARLLPNHLLGGWLLLCMVSKFFCLLDQYPLGACLPAVPCTKFQSSSCSGWAGPPPSTFTSLRWGTLGPLLKQHWFW